MVADIYQAIAAGLTREPRVAPAMFADLLGNPHGPMASVVARYFPQAMSSLGGWLTAQAEAGRIRDLPIPLLLQMLIGPVWAHLLMRQVMGQGPGTPALEEACAEFTAGFLRSVALTTQPRNDAAPRNDAKGD
jgi:hypothetical protein